MSGCCTRTRINTAMRATFSGVSRYVKVGTARRVLSLTLCRARPSSRSAQHKSAVGWYPAVSCGAMA